MHASTPGNRLAGESSPYLRQHAANPVDWYPWSEDAFARARAEGRPVFLSIGYSTCHWCHVMARESFEDPEVAAVLNEHFINVKVDREERPDVDRVYMAYVQATTGSGGWPMSVWLTPERTPFYGGTYFPPEDRWGRPGFVTILRTLARIWREDRGRAEREGEHAVKTLQRYAGRGTGGTAALDAEPLRRGFDLLWESFDERWGGFGDAPKFPRPATLHFLFRFAAASARRGEGERAAAARRLATTTLERMIEGGIHDQLGGGFHRYSVDATWHVPHFEKMLYDQAQIVCALLEAHAVAGDARFAEAARGTLAYVRRDLGAPGGAFFAAEDADSDRPGGGHAEGAFYVWSADELSPLLGERRAPLFAAHHGLRPGGNAPAGSDPHGEFTGLNILLGRQRLAETARVAGVPEAEAATLLQEARAILFAARARRPRPHRDEKILTAWNGLMISAFARAAQVLGEPEYARVAEAAARFLETHLLDRSTGLLRRSHTDDRPGPEGFAEDHAALIQGLLDLHEATFDTHWLRWALELQAALDRFFWDEVGGGYYSSSGRDPSVLVRLKEDHDGAEPAASSIAALNLLRLGRLFGDEALLRRAGDTLHAFAGTLQAMPQAMPLLLAALCDRLEPPRHVVLAGTPGSEDFEALAREVRRRHLPGVVVVAADGGDGQAWLASRAPWLAGMGPVGGRAAAYVCADFACRLPVTRPEDLAAALEG